MKRKCFFIFLLLLVIHSLSFAEKILVETIKVIGDTKTNKNVILYHIPIREHAVYEREQLLDLIDRSKQKLYELGFFYNVELYSVEKETSTVGVIVELQDGFCLRIGGGIHPLFAGMGNLKHRGLFVGIEAGDNFVSLDAWQPLNESLALGIQAERDEEKILNQNLDKEFIALDIRKKIRDVFFLGAKVNVENSKTEIQTFEDNSISLYPYFYIDTRDSVIKTTKGNFFRTELKFKEAGRCGVNGEYFRYNKLAEQLRSRVRVYAQFNRDENNLSDYENNEGIKKFRSELNSQKYNLNTTLASFDLFWDMNDIISPLLFLDGIRTWDKNVNEHENIFAYGTGLKFHFPPPINVNAELTYGRTGNEGKIFFEISYPIEIDYRGL